MFGRKRRAIHEHRIATLETEIKDLIQDFERRVKHLREDLRSSAEMVFRLTQELEAKQKALEELKPAIAPGKGAYVFAARHDEHALDVEVKVLAKSVGAAREKMKRVLHSSWRIINRWKEEDAA